MPKFDLQLSTEEVKSLQILLEMTCASSYYFAGDPLRGVLTKVTLVQLVDDGCMSKREEAYIRDANYPPPDEDGPAY